MAGALLLFGCVAGVLCTHAIMLSIQEEAEVVQLAQVGGAYGHVGRWQGGSGPRVPVGAWFACCFHCEAL